MDSREMAIAERIERVREEISTAATRAGRDSSEINLVAVSKAVERAAVDAAYAAGIRHFGENRVSAAREKFAPLLPDDLRLHLIGQLQSNKARPAVSLFQLIESVDRISLIDALEKEAAILERPIPVLLQVNVAGEAQKAGCNAADAPALVDRLARSASFSIEGLMTIAPLVETAEEVRPVFRQLRLLRDRLRTMRESPSLPILSMGMSNDYIVAIEEGATEVRLGRSLFGG